MLADLKKKYPESELVTSKTGLQYVITKAGVGAKVGSGKNIKAHYTGKLLDGTVFDSSVKRGTPLEFVVGTGRVIKGWDEALSDMAKGEKRTLIIPPDLAYGERGRRRPFRPIQFSFLMSSWWISSRWCLQVWGTDLPSSRLWVQYNPKKRLATS